MAGEKRDIRQVEGGVRKIGRDSLFANRLQSWDRRGGKRHQFTFFCYFCNTHWRQQPRWWPHSKTHGMKQLAAKILVTLACSIIMLHAFVPHHHHDVEGGSGMVFETELGCHCHEGGVHDDGDHRHTHHPFDICLLQEMLSHLVLSTSEDQHTLSALITSESHNYISPDILGTPCECTGVTLAARPIWWPPERVPHRVAPPIGATIPRAPPAQA